jgi:hypothetical protein
LACISSSAIFQPPPSQIISKGKKIKRTGKSKHEISWEKIEGRSSAEDNAPVN